jgi:hypothetical protein
MKARMWEDQPIRCRTMRSRFRTDLHKRQNLITVR